MAPAPLPHPLVVDEPPCDGRRLFVGDVQGCRAELEQLLERAAFDPARDRLLPLGDLVNRGPDSLGVLRLCRDLGARSVLGNHDLHLLEAAAGTRAKRPEDTLDAVIAADDAAELLAWVASWPLVRVHPDAVQLHAGLHPAWRGVEALRAALVGADPTAPGGASDPRVAFLTRARHCDAAGEVPPKSVPRDDDGDPLEDAPLERRRWRPWHSFYDRAAWGGRRAVFGHWAQLGLQATADALGLDTGCVWGGALTGWIPEEDRLVSVPAQRAWCSPFRPR